MWFLLYETYIDYLDEMLFNAMAFLLFNAIAKFLFFLCVRRIELFFLFETHR